MFTRQTAHAATKSLHTNSQRAFQQSLKSPGRAGFAKSFTQDKGNIPIILANLFAVGLILTFAGRKALYHPDVMVQKPNISTNNEGPSRDGNSYEYMDQTRIFAQILAPAAAPILHLANGSSALDQVWTLDWTRNNDKIEIPLEYSNHFNDSLFQHAKPGSPANLNDQHTV